MNTWGSDSVSDQPEGSSAIVSRGRCLCLRRAKEKWRRLVLMVWWQLAGYRTLACILLPPVQTSFFLPPYGWHGALSCPPAFPTLLYTYTSIVVWAGCKTLHVIQMNIAGICFSVFSGGCRRARPVAFSQAIHSPRATVK